MLATLGDLIEDLVVRVSDPVHLASDTEATIARRRGGSAANVAAAAAGSDQRTRFIGQVGDDAIGAALLSELADGGVDVSRCRRAGATGTIVVLVDHLGERSMLTDRGTCTSLDQPDPDWLDDVTTLHVPMYSLTVSPLSATTTTVIGWAHERGIPVSIDVSSVALIDVVGAREVLALLERCAPAIVFANEDEAVALQIAGPVAGAVTVVKRGPAPATIYRVGSPPLDVAAAPVGQVVDTTGAGDAFAAGFLTTDWGRDPAVACAHAHRVAAGHLVSTNPRA